MNHKPYVLVVVEGGVAEVENNDGASVEILDYDNLREVEPEDREFYVKEHYSEMAQAYYKANPI